MVSDLEVCSLLERPILGIVGGRGILEALGKIPDETVCFWPLHSNYQIRQLIFMTQELKDAQFQFLTVVAFLSPNSS